MLRRSLCMLLLAVCEWVPYQEKSIGEYGKDLPARIIRMARNAAMQLPAARFKRQIVAAKRAQALRCLVSQAGVKMKSGFTQMRSVA